MMTVIMKQALYSDFVSLNVTRNGTYTGRTKAVTLFSLISLLNIAGSCCLCCSSYETLYEHCLTLI